LFLVDGLPVGYLKFVKELADFIPHLKTLELGIIANVNPTILTVPFDCNTLGDIFYVPKLTSFTFDNSRQGKIRAPVAMPSKLQALPEKPNLKKAAFKVSLLYFRGNIITLMLDFLNPDVLEELSLTIFNFEPNQEVLKWLTQIAEFKRLRQLVFSIKSKGNSPLFPFAEVFALFDSLQRLKEFDIDLDIPHLMDIAESNIENILYRKLKRHPSLEKFNVNIGSYNITREALDFHEAFQSLNESLQSFQYTD